MTGRTRRALVLVAILAGCLAVAGMGAAALGFRTPSRHYTAMFTQTVGLYPGSDVRVLGVKVGHVTAVRPAGDQVRVDMDVDPDVALAADTDAVIIAPTLVSDRYVQLTKPWAAGPRLASGATLGLARTAVPVEVDDLYKSVEQVAGALGPRGANKDGALSKLIKVGVANLDGNGTRIRRLLGDLGDASRTLVDTGGDTFATIRNLGRLAKVLRGNDRHVGNADAQLARVLHVVSGDRRTLTRAISLLSGAMVDLERFVHGNRGHITRSVRNLSTVTRTLVQNKSALARILGVAPVALQNVLDAYDPHHRLFVTRGNPNDVTIWGSGGSGSRMMLGDGSGR